MPTDLKTYLIHQSPLYMLTRRSKLAKLLRLTDAELRRLSKHRDSLYRERDVPKKSGDGLRHIENPENALKEAQRALANLLSRVTPPNYLFCPVKRRCYVGNAEQHLGNRVVRCLDIKKYFPNTTSRRVFWFFSKIMRCDRAIAGTLTSIACFRCHLPTGSPLSPIMAFFAHVDMWNAIARICSQNSLVLTVYIDDVTVSGASVPEKVMWEIKETIHGAGLRYHKEKAYFDHTAEITGVIVSRDRLVAPDKQFKKIKLLKKEIALPAGFAERSKLGNKLDGLNGQLAQIRKRNSNGIRLPSR